MFKDFEDFTANMEPGRVAQLVRYRQGGDGKSWADPGGSAYVPKGAFLQMGSRAWVGVANTAGVLVFDFPVPFVDKPITLINCIRTTPAYQAVKYQGMSEGPGMVIAWFSDAALTEIWFHWLAIGPGSVT
jgi:hypothetical protein